eukprot:CAMPEP_0202712444 /NCGR_PEP_ID=MMETSP1385-20130828/39976_1 /ASSEMBLY_ACC=CAM_ASM_000861 /TAXON_ID=933848 /ORGANISM="Elphidium margaritaceum" /LENGTH=224 /DNA_ID=CAMNT_0049372481 /DNA_START=57 /DNA_END=731 /DNA_ORIENTATION=+
MNLATNFETLQSDCALINELPLKYLPSFCKLSVNAIKDGINHDKIAKAAQSLNTSAETVTNAICALAQIFKLLCSASVQKASKKVYQETFLPLSLNENVSDAIYEYYSEVHMELRQMLTQFKIKTDRYHTFDWRLDVQIGSRALHRRVDPVYLCELQSTTSNMDSNDNSKKLEASNNAQSDNTQLEKTLFECDYASLENMIQQFELALRETQQSWYKKVSRQTK